MPWHTNAAYQNTVCPSSALGTHQGMQHTAVHRHGKQLARLAGITHRHLTITSLHATPSPWWSPSNHACRLQPSGSPRPQPHSLPASVLAPARPQPTTRPTTPNPCTPATSIWCLQCCFIRSISIYGLATDCQQPRRPPSHPSAHPARSALPRPAHSPRPNAALDGPAIAPHLPLPKPSQPPSTSLSPFLRSAPAYFTRNALPHASPIPQPCPRQLHPPLPPYEHPCGRLHATKTHTHTPQSPPAPTPPSR